MDINRKKYIYIDFNKDRCHWIKFSKKFIQAV